MAQMRNLYALVKTTELMRQSWSTYQFSEVLWKCLGLQSHLNSQVSQAFQEKYPLTGVHIWFGHPLCAGLLGVPSWTCLFRASSYFQAHPLLWGCHLLGLGVTQAVICYNHCPMKTQPNPCLKCNPFSHFMKYRPRHRDTCSNLANLLIYFHLPSWQTSHLSLMPVLLPLAMFFFFFFFSSCSDIRDAL